MRTVRASVGQGVCLEISHPGPCRYLVTAVRRDRFELRSFLLEYGRCSTSGGLNQRPRTDGRRVGGVRCDYAIPCVFS